MVPNSNNENGAPEQEQQDEAASAAAGTILDRALQETPDFNLAGSTCEADGTPYLNGTALANLFADEFQPDCSCVEDSNIDEFGNLLGEGFDLGAFSQFFSDLNIEIEWSCVNKCWICFPSSDCGIFRANAETDYEGIPTNFTGDDIISLSYQELGFVDFLQGFQMQEYCFDYTLGLTGQICWGSTVDVEALGANVTDIPCFMTYDSVECNSCVVSSGCWIADCDNHGVPVVNTCDGTGVDSGLFQVLAYFGNTTNPGDLSVESTCDGGSGEDSNNTFCAGIAGIACPDGLECVDDPADNCDPATGGADCGGICVEPSLIAGPPTMGPTSSQVPTDTPTLAPVNITEAPTETTMEGQGPPTAAPSFSAVPSSAAAAADPTVTTGAPVPAPPTPNTNAPTVSAAADWNGWGRVVTNGVSIFMIVSVFMV